MSKILKNKKARGVSLIIFAMGITAIFAFASFVVDIGIVLNSQNELQKAVESAALVGASNLEPKKDSAGIIKIDSSQVQSIMLETFNKVKNTNGMISSASIPEISVNAKSKAVKISSYLSVNTYFISILGLKSIKVEAQAAAMSAPFYLSANFPKGLVPGSILKETSGDTDIRKPVGDNQNINSDFGNIYGHPDNKALSLGPGGYITIRLPMPLVDGDGADLYISELGNLEGYYVFAGNDKDPSNPYVNEVMPGAGIQWVNISCTGFPVGGADSSGAVGAYYTTVNYNNSSSLEAKFYGSGYFDLGAICKDSSGNVKYNGNIKSATYLKIIDDNKEDGFMADYPVRPVLLIGEHSSISPGADIDAIGILHHTSLISVKDYNKDTDGDGLIDVLENVIGTDISKQDTDSDGINDDIEYSGWFDNSGIKTSIIDSSGATKVYFTNPIEPESRSSGTIFVKK